MKTLADFKRALTIGSVWDALNYEWGSLGRRKVVAVHTNAVAFSATDEFPSWLYFPKAKDIEFPDENTAVIYWGDGEDRQPILKYTQVR